MQLLIQPDTAAAFPCVGEMVRSWQPCRYPGADPEAAGEGGDSSLKYAGSLNCSGAGTTERMALLSAASGGPCCNPQTLNPGRCPTRVRCHREHSRISLGRCTCPGQGKIHCRTRQTCRAVLQRSAGSPAVRASFLRIQPFRRILIRLSPHRLSSVRHQGLAP